MIITLPIENSTDRPLIVDEGGSKKLRSTKNNVMFCMSV